MHKFRELIKKTAKFVADNEKFPIPVLAVRARKAAENDPTDSSIVAVSQILTKMAAKDKMFISKTDLTSLCSKFYNHNSKLNQLFSSEIEKTELLAPKIMRAEGELDMSEAYSKIANPVLSNALEGVFEGKHKIYSNEDAKKAQKACLAGLFSLGLEPKKVSTFAGQDDIIICTAVYDSPKGQCNVLVPIELKEGKALLPTMFLGEHGFVDLAKNTLVQHLKTTAGKSFKVDGAGLLKVLSTAKNGVSKIADEVEMAAIRIKAEKSGMATDPNGIIGMTMIDDSVVADPEIPKHPEHDKFAERLNSPDGVARFVHSDKTVEAGRNVVFKKLAQFGYNTQVRVEAVEDDKILYAVAIGANAGLKVPVKIASGKVLEPVVFIAEGTINSLSKENVSAVIKRGFGDKRALAVASSLFGMSAEALVKEARQVINDGNYTKAEEIINVLGETNKQAQNLVISYMMTALSSNSDTNTIEKAASKLEQLPVSFNTYNIFYPEGA